MADQEEAEERDGETALLVKIFGDKRIKRPAEGCDHCLHEPGGMPLYAVKAHVPNPECCYCGTTVRP